MEISPNSLNHHSKISDFRWCKISLSMLEWCFLIWKSWKKQLIYLLRGNTRNKTSLAPNSPINRKYPLTPTFVLLYRNKKDSSKPGKQLIGSEMFPKGPCIKGLAPSLFSWEVVKPVGGGPGVRKLGNAGHTLKVGFGTRVPFSLCLPAAM